MKLQRVQTKEKSKVQWILPDEMIAKIRVRAAELGKTQSKFIYDLVEKDLADVVADKVNELA